MKSHSHRPVAALHSPLWNLLTITAVLWGGAVVSIGAPAHPEGGDGRGLFVKLELPWTTFIVGETFVFRYTLENASDKSAPIALPVAEMGFRWQSGGQPFLEAIRQGGRRAENPDYDIRKAAWPPRTNVDEEPQAWGQLPPGKKLTWNQNQIHPDYYGVGCYKTIEGVQAHWLVGPNRWISSEPVQVKIVNVPMSECTEVFKVNWSSYGYGKDSRTATIYRIPISGKMYLFVNGWTRVTEVEPDDQFEHQIDKDGTNLEITIKNAKGSRKVYFHLRQGYTRDTPWPIGPVSLFTPVPEPIPPAELEALRKAVVQSVQPPTVGGRPDTMSAPGAPSGDSPAPLPYGKRAWFWIGVSLVIFMVAIVFVMQRKLRQRASINRNANGNPQP